MLSPSVTSRVEQQNDFAGVRIRRVRSSALSERARNTCKSQISQHRFAGSTSWDHMIDVKRGFLTILRDAAILAAIPCAFANTATQRSRYVLAAHVP